MYILKGWVKTKRTHFQHDPSEFCLLVSCQQLLPATSRDLLLCCDFVFKSMNFFPRPDHSPSDHHLPHHLHHVQADTVNPFDTDVSLRPGNLYANLVLAESEQVFYHDYRLADNHDDHYCCLASIMISPPLQLVSAAEAIEKLSAAAAAGLNQDTIEDFTDPVKFIMLTVQNLTSISIIIFAKRCETSPTAQCEKQLRKTKTSGDRFLLPSMFSSSSSSLYSRWFSCNKQWMSVIDVSAPLRVFLSGECRPFLSWIQKIQQLM